MVTPGAFDHTPTPWGILEAEDGRIVTAADGNQYIAKTLDLLDEPANARRIVAAVNATADIPIGVLEGMGATAQQRYEKRMSEAQSA